MMKKANLSIFILTLMVLLAFLCTNSFAQKVRQGSHQVKVYSNSEGFFQNTINDICVDKTGDLWFATVNGLIRFDGYEFFNYNRTGEQNSIQSNNVHALLSDKKGNLWISNYGGLCICDPSKEDFQRIVSSSVPAAFSESPDSSIWVATGTRIDIYHPDQFSNAARTISLTDYLDANINSIHAISNNQAFVVTGQQLFILDVISDMDFKVTLLEPFGFDLATISAIEIDGVFLWIGTTNTLMQCTIDREQLMLVRSYPMNEILEVEDPVVLKSIFIDSDEKIWIGTQNAGVAEFDRPGNTFNIYNYSIRKGLSSPNINCFYEDEYKSIWIGTAQGGVNQIDKTEKLFFSYTDEPYNEKSLSGHLVNAILQDNEGYIWSSFSNLTISKSTAPLTILNDLEFELINDGSKSPKLGEIVAMFQDDRGWIWFCDYTTAYLYDEKNDHFYSLSLKYNDIPFSISRVRKISQIDNETILLVGNSIAIIKNPWSSVKKNQPAEVVEVENFEAGNNAEDLIIDDEGMYWVATQKGLRTFKLDSGKIILVDYMEHLSEDEIEALSVHMLSIHASDNGLWLGTFGKGLINVKFDGNGYIQRLQVLNESDGLSDDMVYGILEDEQNNLWLTTDMGISKLNTDIETFDIFDINDGLLYNNFRRFAYLKTKSNTFVFGGLNGLTIFNPEDIAKDQLPPDVKISQIRINNKKIGPDTKIKGKNIWFDSGAQSAKLILNPGDKSLHLEVITQHSATPFKNKVKYRLDGVDDDWVIVDKGKTILNYTGLRPGNYVFRYMGANGDGLWTAHEKILQIEVLFPWYLRWWSIILEILLFTAVIFAVNNYYLRMQRLKQNLVFERHDKARIQEIDEAKLSLFTNISHEFKTPLSLIIGPLEKMIENNESKENRHYISIIQSNIKRLQRLIEQLVAYRKHDLGKLEIHFSKTKLGDFICPLIDSFEEIMKSRNIAFIHSVDQPEREVVIDTEKAELILFNILSNAVKYTKNDGQIEFRTFFDKNKEGMLTFSVTDNGIGILPENLAKIFDRFYRSERSGNRSGGFGIGLAFSKSLLEALSGVIEVSSEPDSYTTFKVHMPWQNTPDEPAERISREIITQEATYNFETGETAQIDQSFPTLLIIDDEIDFRQFLQHSFKDKYNVIMADSGEEGVEKLQMVTPQAIICDVMMEGMSGFETCEKIKSDPDTCHIPVILLTALSARENEYKSVEIGADYYMQKPFSIQLLEGKVNQLISNRRVLQEHYSRKSYLPDEEIGMPLRERKFLEKINRAIEENLSDSEFSLSDLASNVGFSVSHFSRRLKQITGQVPNVYVRNYRLQKAAEMLSSDRGINTKEVMYEIGIVSPSYFSAAFKKVYGVAPSVYRDTIQEKDVTISSSV